MYIASIILMVISVLGLVGSFAYAGFNMLNEDFDAAFKKHIMSMIVMLLCAVLFGCGLVMFGGTLAVDAFEYVDENVVQELKE